MRTLFVAVLSLGALGLACAAQAQTATVARPPKNVSWSFQGPLGTYDPAALQRGFQIYKEVCSACHSLNRVAFHNLADPGGPDFTEGQVKAIAASYKVPAPPNDRGELFDSSGNRLMRPATPADHFPPPFPNEEAARTANNGALPPDLSLIVKARAGGPAYVYSIITGFREKPPAWFKVLPNKYYNPYFSGWNISMPPPLTKGSVTFADGTPNTLDQEAHDVVTFLSWASEPKMDERKQMGLDVMAFLVAFSGLLFLSYRRIWRDAH
ncbi:MAG TPA: cytochrome c1 [Rhizomicrobium sp.]|jgi:ubiquinol-cytochrome c reductase cytochrome b/c1 subunit|nr:cytochrome c1 [Rhizomicrobium sp.]